jgi:hypothetical protein
MGVSCHLIAIQIGDDKMSGVEVAEGKSRVAFIRLKENHVSLDLSSQRAVAQKKGGNALDLIGALLVPSNGLSVFLQNMSDHLHCGGLAITARNSNDGVRQGDFAQNRRKELQHDQAGKAGAPAHHLSYLVKDLAKENRKKACHSNLISAEKRQFSDIQS